MGKLDKSVWQRMAGAISDCMVREQLSEKGPVELAIRESSICYLHEGEPMLLDNARHEAKLHPYSLSE